MMGNLTMRATVLVSAVLVGGAALTVPAVAQDSGTVSGTVTVPAPVEACVMVSTDAIHFGTSGFGTEAMSPPYQVSSCADVTQTLFAAGTDARRPTGAHAWDLVAPTARGVNAYALDARRDSFAVDLLPEAKTIGPPLQPGQGFMANHLLRMPMPGSIGAGETIDLDIVWTVTLGG